MVKTIILLICMTLVGTSSAKAERLDAIAAIVNGEVITCYEVETAKDALSTQLQQSGASVPDDEALFQRALESRIQRTLQYQEAEKLDLKVSPEEVDAAIANVEKQNNLQPGQLVEVLKVQGIDEQAYRETLKDRILNSRIINYAVRSKLSVSDEAKREYYRKNLKDPKPVREVHTAQMFIALPADADTEAVEQKRAKAEEYYQRFKAGEDFTSVVTFESDAPNASEGGDMGWISEGGVKGAFKQMFDVPVGGITKPIRSAGGFHIVKILDERMREPKELQAYEEVRARHILLQIPDSADVDTQVKIRTRAEDIVKEMQGSSDEAFAARAKEVSQGPSASRGGDLGWFKRGQMVPEFEKVAFSLKPGETSGVVETQFGLHIIRLVEKRKVNPNSYEARKDQIEQLLLETEMQQQVPRWMNGLIEQARIEKRSCEQIVGLNTEIASPTQASVDGYASTDAYASVDAYASTDRYAENQELTTPRAASNETSILEATSALETWRKAWQDKDLETYFAMYDDSHSPDKRFSSFAKWQAYKERVIKRHQDIQIDISNKQEEVLADDERIKISFDQRFKSNRLDDFDHKEMVMEKVWDTWKIVSERTVK